MKLRSPVRIVVAGKGEKLGMREDSTETAREAEGGNRGMGERGSALKAQSLPPLS